MAASLLVAQGGGEGRRSRKRSRKLPGPRSGPTTRSSRALRVGARAAMEVGREWVRKHERTAYVPLVGQRGGGDDGDGTSSAPSLVAAHTHPVEAAELLRGWEARVGLLDLRPEADFDAGGGGHLDGATSLPWGERGATLVGRAHELPPRGAEVSMLPIHAVCLVSPLAERCACHRGGMYA